MTNRKINYIKQLGSDTFVYGIAGTINRFINILLIPIYTRYFSPHDYGALGIALAFYTLLDLTLTSLDNASGRWFFDSDDLLHRKRVIACWFWFQIVLGFALFLATFLLAKPLTNLLFKSLSFKNLTILIGLFAFFSIFGKILSNWLRLLRKPWQMLQYSFFSSIVAVSIIILFVAVLDYGVIGTFAAQVLTGMLTTIVTIVILRRWVGVGYFSTSLFKEMLSFSIPIFPATLAAWVINASDRIIMPFFMKSDEIGIYFLSFQVASVIGVIDKGFQLAWGPFAMSLIGNPDSKLVYSRVLSIYIFLGCWLCLLLTVMAPIFLPLVATAEYSRAASCIPMLVFFFLAVGLTNVIGIGTFIVKDSLPIAKNIFIGSGLSTGLLFILMPIMGKEGAAIAKMIGMFFAVGYIYYASQKRYFIPYKVRDIAVCIVSVWVCIGISYFLPTEGWNAILFRSSICFIFILVGFWLDILKANQFMDSINFIKRKVINLFA
ncbi:MAG: oligosaccharide flippase family protein [Bacteroidales bacterium]|nr:oligosaccharide flippase family protein [Bacteroidales bacterium]